MNNDEFLSIWAWSLKFCRASISALCKERRRGKSYSEFDISLLKIGRGWFGFRTFFFSTLGIRGRCRPQSAEGDWCSNLTISRLPLAPLCKDLSQILYLFPFKPKMFINSDCQRLALFLGSTVQGELSKTAGFWLRGCSAAGHISVNFSGWYRLTSSLNKKTHSKLYLFVLSTRPSRLAPCHPPLHRAGKRLKQICGLYESVS